MDENLFKQLFNNKELITEEILEEIRKLPDGRNIALKLLDLPKNSEEFYVDAFDKKIQFDSNRNLKKAFTKLKLAPIHIKEIEKCAADLDYYRFNYVKIKTKSGDGFPEMREYQQRFLDVLKSESENIVTLFPRQSGKSITTAIYLSWLYLFKESINIGICANRGATAVDFLRNVKNILTNIPIWMQPGTVSWNSRSISNDRGTAILTDATNENSFRGRAIHVLVVDECSFVKNYKNFSDAILPSQSSLAWKKTILISTPSGMNHFYEIVRDAKAHKVLEHIDRSKIPDKNVLEVLDNTDGTVTVTLNESANGFNFVGVDWREVPRYDGNGKLIDPEDFAQSIISRYGIQYFKQNFQCEFIGSSATLINGDTLEKMRSKRPQDRIIAGVHKIHIYDEPQENHKYILSVDPAKNGGDYFAMHVIDITKFPFIQVLSCNLKVDYLEMPSYVYSLATEYNGALAIIENNEGAGQSIADTLSRDYEYSNLFYERNKKYPGYRTTTRSRTQMLNTLKLLIENDKMIINDADTIFELERFVLNGKKYEAMAGYHDDLVMALAISLCMFNDIHNFNDIKEVAERVHSTEDSGDFADMITIGDFDDGATSVSEWNPETWENEKSIATTW